MNINKIIFKIVFLVNTLFFFISSIYGIGLYEPNGVFNYYTNKITPTINVNISSPTEPIKIKNATLIINKTIDTKIYNYNLNVNNYKNFKFKSKNKISNSSINHFLLYAYNLDNKQIIPQGDPTDFFIKLDSKKPEINSQINSIYTITNNEIKNIEVNFNEKISKYQIKINDKIIKNYNNPSKFIKDYIKSFSLNFSTNQLNPGSNNISFNYFDLAENKNQKNFSIFYRGPPLKLYLLTNKNDSNLTYYYDSNYLDFFQKTIYSSSKNFNLKIETSNKSNCFLGKDLTKFVDFNLINSINKIKFNSTNNLNHSIQVQTGTYIEIICQNLIFPDEIVYLNDILKIPTELIKLRYENQTKLFNIKNYFPNKNLTTNLIDYSVSTTKKAECFYKLDSQTEKKIINLHPNSTHKLNSQNIINGGHTINFRCFDHLGKTINKNINFNVNSSKEIVISNVIPKYTNSISQKINFSINDNLAICKFTKDSKFIPTDNNNFENLIGEILGNGFSRYFQTGQLKKGNNTFFINCNKNGNLNYHKINIFYSEIGPQVLNVIFINNNVESNYLGSKTNLQIKIIENSTIPIEKNFIELTKNSGSSLFYNSPTNRMTIRTNLSGVKSIKIIAQNRLGINSSIFEKRINFDFDKPQISLEKNGNSLKILCHDIQGECYKIFYGLSKTNIDCSTNIVYRVNSNIDFNGNNYICIKAIDYVGNIKEETKTISFGFNETSNNSINISNSNFNSNESFQTSPQNNYNNSFDNGNNKQLNNNSNSSFGTNTVNDSFFNETNINTSNQGSNSPNYLIFAAIFILLAGVSGGGYYAYRKGYLNNQLKKMGIKNLPNENKNFKSNYYNSPDLNKNNLNKNNFNNGKINKSSYDEHLNKLNKFINEKIESKKTIFDKFDTDKHTGKVKNYEDTLIKKTKKEDITKEDFDEFYDSSKKIKNSKSTDLEKNSEEFEEFYKDKKKDKKNLEKQKNNKSEKNTK